MKYLLLIVIIFSILTTQAQINIDKLYDSWVITKITFKDGSPLPDDNLLKFAYQKYKFSRPDKVNFSSIYFEVGTERSFEVNNGYLAIKSPEGFIINTLQIESLKDTLVLIQRSQNGFDDPQAIRYYFVPEKVYQEAIPFKTSDIHSITGSDTIYKESSKIYASYDGPSYQRRVYDGMSGRMDGKSGHFLAFFTVFKSGMADSLRIIEGIDDGFSKRFIKVFNQTKKDWTPAIYGGKKVNVLMSIDLRYSTSASTLPAYFAGQKANAAFIAKQYEIALFYYDEALKSSPTDREFLNKRGLCKLYLGNKSGACEDWNAAKAIGLDDTATALLEKYCK